MKQFRIKGQALTLVLIVVVLSIVIAFSITTRIVADIKQQGEERASTRAEAFAEAAVENITQKLQSGELAPDAAGTVTKFGVSNADPTNGQSVAGNLSLCQSDSTDVSKQCDPNSIAQVSYYKMIIQFKVFNSENIEVQMTDTASTSPRSGAADSTMLLHFKENATYSNSSSKVLVKGFSRTLNAGQKEVKVVSECVIELRTMEAQCLPANYMVISKLSCPDVKVTMTTGNNATVESALGETCFSVHSNTGISFYRVKPLLSTTQESTIPYIDISATGNGTTSYNLPIPQMAVINAGVYSGTRGSDQQVFQQSTRLILLNKAVPEIADYVLYNGSDQPIQK